MSIIKFKKNLVYNMRELLGSSKVLFPFMKYYPFLKGTFITKETHICIEGFPRSANSFLYHLIKRNNDINIASHLHVIMQIYFAKKYEIPCVILIRDPLEAIASLITADENISVERGMKSYLTIYEYVYKNHTNELILEFKNVTNKPLETLEQINKRFEINLEIPNSFNEKEVLDELQEIHKNSKNNKLLIPVPSDIKKDKNLKIRNDILNHKDYPKVIEIYKKNLSFL